MELKEGHFYQRGDGEITGSLVLTKDLDGAAMQRLAKGFPFYDPKFKRSYAKNGKFTEYQVDLEMDLVAEFIPLPDLTATNDSSRTVWA